MIHICNKSPVINHDTRSECSLSDTVRLTFLHRNKPWSSGLQLKQKSEDLGINLKFRHTRQERRYSYREKLGNFEVLCSGSKMGFQCEVPAWVYKKGKKIYQRIYMHERIYRVFGGATPQYFCVLR